ncbi:MAG: FtsX-like permease family protein [Acidobacteriota bacterium]
MGTHLAWHDLKHRRARTAAALVGVSFAIVLIFMQAGFYEACKASAIRIHRLLDFDLMVVSKHYSFIMESSSFPPERLAQAEAVDGVAATVPVHLFPTLWRNPQTANRYDLALLGVDPSDHPFLPPTFGALMPSIQPADTVLFDRDAHPILGHNPAGTWGQVEDRRLQVVGDFAWGVGFVGQGLAVASEETLRRVSPGDSGALELGLVRVEPGADVDSVAAALEQRLPPDVQVWTRSAIEARDQRFFLRDRPIGLMFTSGLLLAIFIGGVILFQVLASEVTSRKGELATLQALGYTRRQVYGVVLEQGLLYAAVAFLPAVAAAVVLFAVTRRLARLPMHLGPGLVLAVFGVSLAMCLVGALAASARVRSADPADLF